MRYTLRRLSKVLLFCLIVGVPGFFVMIWFGMPMIAGGSLDLINPSTGRPVTGAEARQTELLESNQKALAEYQESHKGQDSPFTP